MHKAQFVRLSSVGIFGKLMIPFLTFGNRGFRSIGTESSIKFVVRTIQALQKNGTKTRAIS